LHFRIWAKRLREILHDGRRRGTSGKTQIPNPWNLLKLREDDQKKARKSEITLITKIRLTKIGSHLF